MVFTWISRARMKREESHWCDGANSATRQGKSAAVMWSGRGSKGMVLESKRDPRMCPRVPK